MTTVQFYHLTASPLERALPKLLEKCFAGGFRTLVVAPEAQLERLDQLLWTYHPGSFLPHGRNDPERQPIFLSSDMASHQSADLLAVTDGRMPEDANAFKRILDIFDGKDADAVEKARARWTLYKSAGCEVTYLRQTDQGAWEQKAA